MKIAYLHSVNGPQFNDAFEELINGLSSVDVLCKTCPPKVTYKDVKGCDIVIFDVPSTMKKILKYLPEITDDRVKNLKLGILTSDFWIDLCSIHTDPWLRRNRIKDFIIFRHSSGLQFFKKDFKLFVNALKEKVKISGAPHKFVDISKASVNFDHAIFCPFTINSDRMKLSDSIEKTYDICIGAHVCSWYPLRERILNIVEKSGRFKCINPAISKTKKKREFFTDYYRGISSSWLSIATTGLANISVRKHYEICGLGSTCLGNETGLPDHDIIRPNVVDINPKLSDKEILEGIEKTIDNKKRLRKLSGLVKEEVRKTYDYRNVAKKLKTDIIGLFE